MSNQQNRVFWLNPEASASANSAIRALKRVLRGKLIVPARGGVCQRDARARVGSALFVLTACAEPAAGSCSIYSKVSQWLTVELHLT